MSVKTAEQIRRSPFFYVGDKFKLVSQLKKYFPDNIERFIEPFCGGGSVFMNVSADEYLLNDIDYYMIELHKFLLLCSKDTSKFWSDIQSVIEEYNLSASFLGYCVPDEYKKAYVKTYYAKYNKNSYINLRNDFNSNKNELIKLYLLLIYGFNRMLRFNRNGDFNLPVGNVDFNNNVVNALNEYFEYVVDKEISFFNMDFQDFIDKISPTNKDFIYLDPPYLITSSEYNKLWNEECEIRLINLLDELNTNGIRFAVSNVIRHKERVNELFCSWAKKYDVIQVNSNYISYHDNTQKDSYEVLVKNY